MENEAEKIRDHFVYMRDQLKRKGIDAQQLADLLGVKRQTTYQYGFSPDARGARIVPAESLERMRVLYTRLHFEKLNLEYPPFLDRKLVEWIYVAADDTIVSARCRAHAEFLRACRGCTVSPSPHNADPDKSQYAAEVLGLRWLRAFFSKNVTREEGN